MQSILGVRRFRSSFYVLWCYLRRSCPSEQFIQTRSGLRIHLSGDEDDIPTLLVIFGRQDYGRIPAGATVIDVGAHLGSFSLYAIESGAANVYSYEPDPNLYGALIQNVSENDLQGRILPFRMAVIGRPAATVTFYPEGNASGHVNPLTDGGPGISVSATTLEEIVLRNRLDRVDFLKLDCEGSEYEIIFNTPAEIWRRIERVRLEYHYGRAEELKKFFREIGFHLVFSSKAGPRVGLLAFDRLTPQAWLRKGQFSTSSD